MNFSELHERLRLELVRRINGETLTGSRLAQQTGFRQAHISNFLNRKRALSLDGLDRVLAAQNLTINQILPSASVNLEASAENRECYTETLPLVPPTVAMNDGLISPQSVLEYIPVSTALLYENRSRCSSFQANWRRFVAIRVETQQASAMEPLLVPGAVAIIDRHYTSLAQYRSHQRNLYAIRARGTLQLRFAEFDDNRLIIRPNSTAFPIQLVPVHPGQSPSDLIVGRLCLVFNEL